MGNWVGQVIEPTQVDIPRPFFYPPPLTREALGFAFNVFAFRSHVVKRTFQPSKLVRARRHGYRARMAAGNRGPHKAYAWFEAYLQAEQRMHRIGDAVDPTTTAQQLVAITFFQAFTERFLGHTPSPAADRKWAAAHVAALSASWTPPKRR